MGTTMSDHTTPLVINTLAAVPKVAAVSRLNKPER